MTRFNFLEELKKPTFELQQDVLQKILTEARNHKSVENEITKWEEVTNILWIHLQAGLRRFDDQLLCATCFYTTMQLTDKQGFYLGHILSFLQNELAPRDENVENDSKRKAVALMYGLFQSSYLTHNSTKDISNVGKILEVLFDLLISLAYEYSKYTFISFKIIQSFKKVLKTELQGIIYSKEHLIKLLNLTNHNWENPITGVRDLNKSIFQTIVPLFDKTTNDTVLKEINGFYWNKAKYLMLSEIIGQSKDNIVNLTIQNDWISGLIYSLHKPGLVSAGADMYYAILKNLNSENDWCTLFLREVMTVLNGKTNKAIENFCNYWYLATLKKFPQIMHVLLEELIVEESGHKLYSFLCVLKQGNKLGLVNKTWDQETEYGTVEKILVKCLEHSETRVRQIAFEIVCINQGKSMPTSNDYILILNYVKNNINSDCTVLRINMLNNLSCFLQNLHSSYLNNTKNNQDNITEYFGKFYKSLQELIIYSLSMNGNYQRKVTSIKLCSILFSSLHVTPKKRQKQIKTSESHLMNFLKETNNILLLNENSIKILFRLLKDPADDIRENTVQLLLEYYSKEINTTLLNYLIKDAQECIRSKFFYEISCGHSIFKLIASLLIKENYNNTRFQSVEDVFCFAFHELQSEIQAETDIVIAIENGKQLHSFLGVLLEILKVAKQNSYEMKVLEEKVLELLDILESVSRQFDWEEQATSSDFSKMSDMVKNIIASSGYNAQDEKDFTKISGLEQIVLNCLWLNVKASCDLASFMIEFLNEDHQAECERCLTIITRVLETSRHKGAIEAAGAALGRSIQHLTSLPDRCGLSYVPQRLLRRRLQESAGVREGRQAGEGGAASVTRRGAGLSIMVHRIVASDLNKAKPLFHYFMETILECCRKPTEDSHKLDDNQKDLPRAVNIHFLTRVVADSGLASDTMFYSAQLAEIAFSNLTSPLWQIRNAALQLYGALIPKLIGQKKASGTEDETVATVACDEFRTHSPDLWRRIEVSLTHIDTRDLIQSHSNLIPILNILANLAKRYNFSFDSESDISSNRMLQNLVVLLGSPIYTVRRLTAKCIFNLYSFKSIFEVISQNYKRCVSENYFHGSLLLIAHCRKYYKSHEECFEILTRDYDEIIKESDHSYICKQIFEEFSNKMYDLDEIKDTLKLTKLHKHAPGIFLWANSRLRKYIEHCFWEYVPNLLKIVLDHRDFEEHCAFILEKINYTIIPENVALEIGEILLCSQHTMNSGVIWKILYEISLKVRLNNINRNILKLLQKEEVSYKMRYAIPFFARIAHLLPKNELENLSGVIFMLSDPKTADIDMRYISALANNELAKAFDLVTDLVKVTALKTAIVLLQDEDEDIRLLSIHFYSILTNENIFLHPYICLQKILNVNFLKSVLKNPQIEIPSLCKDLIEILDTYGRNLDGDDDYNPFSNDSKNIYFEAEKFRQLINEVKTTEL